MNPSSLISSILVLTTLSGAVALVYEVVFFRSLGLIFGVNVHAVAAVVASFLGGLGLGAWGGGRWLARGNPLVIYAKLEFGVAIYGYLSPFLFRWAGHVVATTIDDPSHGFPLRTLLVAFFLLLPPTFLMGATFPVLGRAIAAGSSHVARRIGWLYGLNTLGAFIGTVTGAFLILPSFGMLGSSHLAAGGNLLLGVAALAIARRWSAANAPIEPETTERIRPTRDDPARGTYVALIVAVAAVGFASIALQVLGNRLLITLLGASVYTFATVLGVFLIGIGVGGAVGGGLLSQGTRPLTRLASATILLGGAIGIGIWSLRRYVGPEDPLAGATNLYLDYPEAEGLFLYVRLAFLLATLSFLPATLLSGAILPAVTRFLATDDKRLSRGLGSIYLWNTIGSIVGSLAAGFYLLPALGLRLSLAVSAVAAAGGGGALAFAARRRGETQVISRTVAALLISAPLAILGLRPGESPGSVRGYTSIFYAESEASAVNVIEFYNPNEPRPVRSLAINGKVVASSLFVDRRLQQMLGFIPTLLHPDPQKILSIALGTGMSSGALAVSGAKSVEIVELSKGVIDACYLFDEWNAKVDRRPNVTIHNDDGRRFLTRSNDRYDLISADPIHPWVAGSAYLYTTEYYEIAREHLAPGGMMTQWIPLYQLSTEDIGGITKSFSSVFSDVSAWVTGYDMVLLGTMEPLEVDPTRVAQRMISEPTRSLLADIGIHAPQDLLGCYFANRESLLEFANRAATVITDDRPWIEFSAPKSLFLDYPSEVFIFLANTHDTIPLVDGVDEALREDILNASQKFRMGAIRFVGDIELGMDIPSARSSYSDLLREGYRRGETPTELEGH